MADWKSFLASLGGNILPVVIDEVEAFLAKNSLPVPDAAVGLDASHLPRFAGYNDLSPPALALSMRAFALPGRFQPKRELPEVDEAEEPPAKGVRRPEKAKIEIHADSSEWTPLQSKELFSQFIEGLSLQHALSMHKATPGSHKFREIEKVHQKYLADHPPVKPLPTNAKQLKSEEGQLPFYWFSQVPPPPHERVYTLLVLGHTGVGKTTLLDCFVNCLQGQSLQDPFRWKLADEDAIKEAGASGASVTRDLKEYIIWDQRKTDRKCHIRLIDTPGFGDTGGVKIDEETTEKFKTWFDESGIDELDYVLWVEKSSQTRWGTMEKYIHSMVLSLFGKDMASRFILMCTHGDGGQPNSVKLLNNLGVRFETWFKFNNSALYQDPDVGGMMTKMFWDIGMASAEQFLTYVVDNSIVPVSTGKTREVLLTRQLMKQKAGAAKDRIQEGFSTLERSVHIQQTIIENRDAINAGRDFTTTHTHEQLVWVDFDPDETRYQYCAQCNCMCCQVCAWPAGVPQSPCTYFDTSKFPQHRGLCPICPGNCAKDKHTRPDQKPVKETVTETIIIPGKKAAYDTALAGKSHAESLLWVEKEKMDATFADLMRDMQIIQECQQKLEEISLEPGLFTQIDLFEQMIAGEEKAKQPGWQKRVEGLQLAKEKLELIQKLTTASSVGDLFPQYQELMQFMSEAESAGTL